MSLVAAAICPHPPLIVPEVAQGAAGELDALRSACRVAIGRLADARPDEIVVVGDGPVAGWYSAGEMGSLAAYGVKLTVVLGGGPGEKSETLPLSLTVGAWLLGPTPAPVVGLSVPADAAPEECLRLGAGCAGRADRVALLVMGDGSARRGPTAPGYDDPRAEPYDREAARALAEADAGALAALDPQPSAELLVAGRAPWQVLAGAAGSDSFRGELLYSDAPYGVAYLVASWELA